MVFRYSLIESSGVYVLISRPILFLSVKPSPYQEVRQEGTNRGDDKSDAWRSDVYKKRPVSPMQTRFGAERWIQGTKERAPELDVLLDLSDGSENPPLVAFDYSPPPVREVPFYVEPGFPDVIDWATGVPRTSPPKELVNAFVKAVRMPGAFEYPTDQDDQDLRKAIVKYMSNTFNVRVDADKEVAILNGVEPNIHLLVKDVLAPLDYLTTVSNYPAFARALRDTRQKYISVPQVAESPLNWKAFMPDFGKVFESLHRKNVDTDKIGMLVVTNPHNPTGRILPFEYLQHLADIANQKDLLVIHDASHAEIATHKPGHKPRSMWEIPGAKSHVLEFHNVSKTSTPGARIAFAIGPKEVIAALNQELIQRGTDIPRFIQKAFIYNLNSRAARRARRDMANAIARQKQLLENGLKVLGWETEQEVQEDSFQRGTPFLRMPVPKGAGKVTDKEFAERLYREAGIEVHAGSDYADPSYLRITVGPSKEEFAEGLRRLRDAGFSYAKPQYYPYFMKKSWKQYDPLEAYIEQELKLPTEDYPTTTRKRSFWQAWRS
jgi:alanine-synthesizing transaminase